MDFLQGLIAPPLTHTDFVLPWLVISGLSLLLWAYYYLEGRKRIAAGDAQIQHRLQQFMNGLGWIGLMGAIFAFTRWGDLAIFAWQLWLALWGLAVAAFVLYWVWYLTFKYPGERAAYVAHITHQQYLPKPKR